MINIISKPLEFDDELKKKLSLYVIFVILNLKLLMEILEI